MQKEEMKNIFESAFPFWEKLNTEDKELLVNSSSFRKFNKNECIHSGSNECTGAILVLNGCVRSYILSEDGREITLYRLYKNDICMLSASCVLKSVTFDVFVDAETECDCIIVGGNALAQITSKNIYAENFALNIAVERFSDVMWLMQQILFMSFDRRLAIFLYDEISKSGTMTVNMTHEQIAKYTGSAREVVSRMLKYFENENIVKLSRGGVEIIDKKKLRAVAG